MNKRNEILTFITVTLLLAVYALSSGEPKVTTHAVLDINEKPLTYILDEVCSITTKQCEDEFGPCITREVKFSKLTCVTAESGEVYKLVSSQYQENDQGESRFICVEGVKTSECTKGVSVQYFFNNLP